MNEAIARRNRVRGFVACLCAASLLFGLNGCFLQNAWNAAVKQLEGTDQTEQPEKSAQPTRPAKAARPASHAKIAEPVPEPTEQELAEYVRGKLLGLSPSDGFNDNLDVRFDPASGTLTVIQPQGRCDHYLGSLDANNLTWDIFDPGDTHNGREELLRLTITSVSGKTARACIDKKGQPEEGTSTNRIRMLFLLAKSEEISGFEKNMATAMRKLIVQTGGAQEKEIFAEPKDKTGHAKK